MSDSGGPHCSACGAPCEPRALRCTQCGGTLPAGKVLGAPTPPSIRTSPHDSQKSSPPQFSLGGLVLVITLLCVCFALLAWEPGVGIFACMVSLPPLIRTILLSQRWKGRGHALSPTQKVTAFVGSLGVTILSVIVMTIIAGVSFFVSCLAVLSTNPSHSGSGPIFVVICVTGAVVLWATWGLFYLIRRRWKRDTTQLPPE